MGPGDAVNLPRTPGTEPRVAPIDHSQATVHWDVRHVELKARQWTYLRVAVSDDKSLSVMEKRGD